MSVLVAEADARTNITCGMRAFESYGVSVLESSANEVILSYCWYDRAISRTIPASVDVGLFYKELKSV